MYRRHVKRPLVIAFSRPDSRQVLTRTERERETFSSRLSPFLDEVKQPLVADEKLINLFFLCLSPVQDIRRLEKSLNYKFSDLDWLFWERDTWRRKKALKYIQEDIQTILSCHFFYFILSLCPLGTVGAIKSIPTYPRAISTHANYPLLLRYITTLTALTRVCAYTHFQIPFSHFTRQPKRPVVVPSSFQKREEKRKQQERCTVELPAIS